MCFQKTAAGNWEEDAYFTLYGPFPVVGSCLHWPWLVYEGGRLGVISQGTEMCSLHLYFQIFKLFLESLLLCVRSKE